jgi:hypothetical protein
MTEFISIPVSSSHILSNVEFDDIAFVWDLYDKILLDVKDQAKLLTS